MDTAFDVSEKLTDIDPRIQVRGYGSGVDLCALRAAWTILVNACDGRLLETEWIDRKGGRLSYVYDADTHDRHLSTSDRQVLGIAHSLLDDERPVRLGTDLALIRPEDIRIVLEALQIFVDEYPEDFDPDEDEDLFTGSQEHDPSASASGPAAAPSASASGATGDADEQAEQTTDSEAGDR